MAEQMDAKLQLNLFPFRRTLIKAWLLCLVFSLLVSNAEDIQRKKGSIKNIHQRHNDSMADDINVAEKSVNLLRSIAEASDIGKLHKSLSLLTNAVPIFGFIGSFLGLLGAAQPDNNQLIKELANLNKRITMLRMDNKDLKQLIKWEATKTRYHRVFDRIKYAVSLSNNILKSVGNMKNLRNELKRFCDHEQCSYAVWSLSHGTNDILTSYYDQTGGNRPKMIHLGKILMEVLVGGISSLVTYKFILLGNNARSDYEHKLSKELAVATKSIKEAIDKCTNNFRENMGKDLEAAVIKGGSNAQISRRMFSVMAPKYDWLHIATYVYNDMKGWSWHTFSGSGVSRLHFHSKVAIAFYLEKGERALRSIVNYYGALKILKGVLKGPPCPYATCLPSCPYTTCSSANKIYSEYKAALDRNHVRWWGLVVNTHSWNLGWWRRGYADRQFTTDWRFKVYGLRNFDYYSRVLSYDYFVLIG